MPLPAGRQSALVSMLVAVLCCGSAEHVRAQPLLYIDRLDVQWPYVTVRVNAECGLEPVFGMRKQDFHIYENGREVHNFSYECPDSVYRCPISVALAFDVSGSMAGAPIAAARAAGNAFLDALDGTHDEACVIAFNKDVRVLQGMTTKVPVLRAAVQSLAAGGGTAVWDAVRAGVEQAVDSGSNPCRGVVLLTDGTDTGSGYTYDDVLAFARASRVPVFIIALGKVVDSTKLAGLAQNTGGRLYFAPTPDELERLYAAVTSVILRGANTCTIRYRADCIADRARTVEVQLSMCGGVGADRTTFVADSNAGVSVPMTIAPVRTVVAAGDPAAVPIVLSTAGGGLVFPPIDGTLAFDSACMRFDSLTVPAASVLGAATIACNPVAGGVRFRIDGTHLVPGAGTLLVAHFLTRPSAAPACCALFVERWSFDDGCLAPVTSWEQVCTVPCRPAAVVTARPGLDICTGDTTTLAVDSTYRDYVWYRDGVPCGGTGAALRVAGAGAYEVETTDRYGCTRRSDAVRVRTFPRRAYAIVLGTAVVPAGATRFELAIDAGGTFVPGERVELTFDVDCDTTLCTPDGVVDGDAGLLDSAAVERAGGVARVHFAGIPSAARAFALRFRVVRHPLAPANAHVVVGAASSPNPCVSAAIGAQPVVLLDGTCERLLAPPPIPLRVGNAPNPFSASTEVTVVTERAGELSVAVLDAFGRTVAVLDRGARAAGEYRYAFDARGLAAGTYLVRARLDGAAALRTALVVK